MGDNMTHESASLTDGAGPIDDSSRAVTPELVRRHALVLAMRNLLPMPVVVLAFPVFVTLVLRSSVATGRAAVWLAVGVSASAVMCITQCQYHHARRRAGEGGRLPRGWQPLLVIGLVLCSSVFGMGTWVVAGASTEVIVLCAVFPAIAGVIAAITLPGSRGLLAAFLVPTVAITSIGLLEPGVPLLRALAGTLALYSVGVVLIYQIVSRSVLAEIEVRARSASLLALLDGERQALRAVNEELSNSNAQLAHLALHDPLTGLYNRRGTLEMIDRALSESTTSLCLLFCDLDRFKSVNDSLGHRGGDQFLAVLADRIDRTLDADCIAGRIGGDEFVVALPNHDLAQGAAVASRLVGVLGQAVRADGREVPSSVSIGVAAHPDHGATSGDLLRNANAALFRAKRAGRNRVEVFDGGMQSERDAEARAEQQLRHALDNGEILPFFQPEIDATSGRIVGAELLARWLRRDGTLVHAAEFLALATRAGLLERLTERMLREARPTIRRLALLGLPDGFRFRVNLAPATTDRSWRDSPLDELLGDLDPKLLTVDVRESAVTLDLPAAAGTLAAFRVQGGRVCLDDFARGVSSLSLLRKLPIDEVRIDRQAIDTIGAHPHDRAIVRSIITVVREIGLEVTAEGVETGAQADALIALGCIRQQGHLYAPALPVDGFESFLLERLAEGYISMDAPVGDWDADPLL